MKLRCAIIDDEPLSITVLESYLGKIPNVEVVATFNSALSVFEFLSENNIDFLFLDVEMPGLSGIDFLKSLVTPPLIIITSANKNYALDGFELNVVDFLLKPLTLERVIRAVNKVSQIIIDKLHHHDEGDSADYIFLKENKKNIRIQTNEILYIESIRDYVKVVTKDKSVVTKQKLRYFEELFPTKDFVRVHKSFIVSVKHIDAFSSATIEIGRHVIPIGRLYKDSTLKIVGNISDIE